MYLSKSLKIVLTSSTNPSQSVQTPREARVQYGEIRVSVDIFVSNVYTFIESHLRLSKDSVQVFVLSA